MSNHIIEIIVASLMAFVLLASIIVFLASIWRMARSYQEGRRAKRGEAIFNDTRRQ